MQATLFFEQAKKELHLPQDTKLTSAYQFGGDPDKLAKLVLHRIKTATSSAFDLYEGEETDPIPKAGGYDVILDSQNNPICVTITDYVKVIPFKNVDSYHAYREGEGDKSLNYWNKIHRDFFEKEFQEEGKIFNPLTSNVVIEEFHIIYPKK
ncbi:ASCH domain-containing protein [Holzapfeliella sp. He02]|uniref:ASCH domain-containing protein n=1 Tax=Holzapfeliella saturejae TaxID=3082953 RepID=A0ABU8SHW2_9LACO